MQGKPLILTLKLDEKSQGFFNIKRQLYFPPERNHLEAHLMLFHQLPNESETYKVLEDFAYEPFSLNIVGLMNLGAGVAYRAESSELNLLHKLLSTHFKNKLIPQDLQGFRPHITIMNKTTPERTRALIKELSVSFEPFSVDILGIDIWQYLGGPWQHKRSYAFVERLLDDEL
ncbi:2'-5' RNA ligase family protein [Mucilaginibacter sp. SMC90]|uniref:2'-5' RNA ligase family protein n=1 Tax=Mucilaginibacter sp. SMC90 TaxID=2929803 RepID=UPI001FB3012F|nr:2'-5' RNA ligase family protein [Mucilaginibacter sp. SMC90]UOE52848.1 2'-5' RNA ligase family protein [Mucilaginibacter sp. SMC90]